MSTSTRIKNQELFENMPVAKAVRTMCVPTVIGQLIVLIYNMADTFFIGRTGNPYMVAGASLILPLFNIALPIAALAGIGGGSLISRLLGQYRKDEAQRVSSFCVWFAILMAAMFSAGVFLFMQPLLHLLGAGTNTFDYARIYALCVIVAGGIPTILTNVLAHIVRSIGESKKAGFGVTLGGVINIILDPLFMFVILPKGNEILGAGIATCISNCISCAYFMLVIKKLGRENAVSLAFPKVMPEKSSIKSIFFVGIPASVTTLLFDVDYIIIDKLMSAYSDVALAAVGIVLKVERLPLNIGVGICQGMVPIVAYNYSSKNYKRMKDISRFALLSGIVCAVISIALYELFSPQIMQFFINEPETIAIGTGFLRIRCIATIFMFMSFYHVHLFDGYGRGKESLLLGLIRWVGFNIPMLFLLNHFIGMYGIVWAQAISDFMTVIVSLLVHRRYMKKYIDVV